LVRNKLQNFFAAIAARPARSDPSATFKTTPHRQGMRPTQKTLA